jgi:hypothetical protein
MCSVLIWRCRFRFVCAIPERSQSDGSHRPPASPQLRVCTDTRLRVSPLCRKGNKRREKKAAQRQHDQRVPTVDVKHTHAARQGCRAVCAEQWATPSPCSLNVCRNATPFAQRSVCGIDADAAHTALMGTPPCHRVRHAHVMSGRSNAHREGTSQQEEGTQKHRIRQQSMSDSKGKTKREEARTKEGRKARKEKTHRYPSTTHRLLCHSSSKSSYPMSLCPKSARWRASVGVGPSSAISPCLSDACA